MARRRAHHRRALRGPARALGNGLAIRLIDERLSGPGGSWTELDRQLAGGVLRRTQTTERTLVVCGNAHTPTHPTGLGLPMGAWIARSRPGVREIPIDYATGGYFNLGSRTFTPAIGADADQPPRLSLTRGALRLTIGRAHEATVPARRGLSPSTL